MTRAIARRIVANDQELLIPQVSSYVLRHDGVFVGAGNGGILAVRLDKTLVWSVPLNAGRFIADGNDTVYASTDNAIVAIDAQGQQTWTLPFAPFGELALGRDHVLYATDGSTLYAIGP